MYTRSTLDQPTGGRQSHSGFVKQVQANTAYALDNGMTVEELIAIAASEADAPDLGLDASIEDRIQYLDLLILFHRSRIDGLRRERNRLSDR